MQWMDEEGMCPPWLKEIKRGELDEADFPEDILDLTGEALSRFFMTHTKSELYEGAVKRRAFLYSVSDPKDVVENAQLASRDFWVKLDHPELDDTIAFPGPFVKASETPSLL